MAKENKTVQNAAEEEKTSRLKWLKWLTSPIIVVLGIAAQHMDFTKEQWYEVIEHTVPPKTIEINKKAFDVGYTL